MESLANDKAIMYNEGINPEMGGWGRRNMDAAHCGTYLSNRMQRRLNAAAKCMLTTIVAPAGYGKTTAARQLGRLLPDRAVVLRQRVRSASTADFWSGLVRMLRPLSRECAAAAQQMGLPEDPVHCKQLLYLLEDAMRTERREIYLIVDDFQLLERMRVYPLLSFLLRHMPQQLHVVLLSRTPVLSKRDSLLLAGQVNEITAEDLQFQRSDILAYFQQCGYLLAEETADWLETVSCGWPAALQWNAAQYMRRGCFADETDTQEMMRKELLDPLTVQEKQLVQAVCLLPWFTQEQAVRLCGREMTSVWIGQLEQQGILLAGHDGWRLPPPLRACACAALSALPEIEQKTYVVRCGQCLLEQGKIMPAMRMFYRAGAFRHVLQVLECDRGASLTAEDQDELLGWLADCPEEICAAQPLAMLVCAGQLCAFHRQKECREVLDSLQRRICENSALPEQERKNWLGEIAIITGLLCCNDLAEMTISCRRACALMDRPTRTALPDVMWGLGSPGILAMYHRRCGRMAEELEQMKQFLSLWQQLHAAPDSGAVHIMEGEWQLLQGHLTNATISMHRAMSEAQQRRQDSLLFAGWFLDIRVRLLQGEITAMNSGIAAMRRLAEQKPMLLHMAELCEAWLYALQGQPDRVARWIANGELEQIQLPHVMLPLLQLVYGQVLLAQDDCCRLLAREAPMRTMYRSNSTLLCEIYLDIQLASACHRLGRTEDAMHHLEQALEQAMPDQLYLPFVEHTADLCGLLRRWERPKWQTEVQQVLTFMQRYAPERVRMESGCVPLSPRERKIAALAAAGKTNKEIAAAVCLSESRVKTILSGIFQKLGIAEEKEKRRALRGRFE